MSEPVTLHTDGRIAQLTLNRPDKFNCISQELLQGLLDGIERAETTPGIRVIVVTSNGPHFCTGADLDEVRAHSQSRKSLDEFIGFGHHVMQRMENSSLPVIAAVQGYCLAGGMELMMSADIVFAAADARIGCQHAQYGLVPGWGGSQRLPRLVGMRRAMELMFSARWLDAATAADWGLVNSVVDAPELVDEASAFAQTLATRNPEGIGAMKRLTREGAPLSIQAALELEQSVAVSALLSDNVAEGLRAFRDRREPRFSD